MSRPIAYNKPGAAINGSITNEDAVISYVVDGRGNDYYNNYESCLWVPSADGAAPIVFVTDTFTRGYEGDPNLAVPLFFACAGTSSAAILYTANRLPGSPGNYSNANTALDELNRIYGYFILESNDPFEGINATSLGLDIDASKMTSYPQTGNNWYDLSGNGNTGALTNGPTFVLSSGSFLFDGIDDYVSVNNNNGFGTVGTAPVATLSFTANLQRKSGGGTQFQQVAGFRNDPSLYNFFFLLLDSSGATVNTEARLRTTAGIYDINVDFTSYFDKWTRVDFIANSNRTDLYLNSNLVGSNTSVAGTFGATSGEFRIGNGFGVFPTKGQIQDTRFYSRALTQAEIKQNYFGSPIVTDGLVYAFDANNIVSYPKSGTTWYRLTGSVDCSLINGPTFNSANGGSIVFDGTDDQGNIPANAENILTTVSGEAWVKILGPAQVANYHVVFQKEGGFSGGSVYGIRLQESGGITVMQAMIYYSAVSGESITLNGTTNLNDGNWHHVAFTYDSSYNLRVFVDGEQENIATGTNVPFQNSSNIQVALGDGRRFNGALANFKIYNRALSASEILQNYQAEQYRFAGPQGIVTNGLTLWLDAGNLESYPGTGTTWFDLSGNNNNGTLKSATQWSNLGWMNYDGNSTDTETTVATVEINTNSAQGNTVEQWIYGAALNGNGNMPFTWLDYGFDLWWYSDLFGINNGNSLVYGISGANSILLNNWVHVVAYFPYDWAGSYTNAKFWINGVAQSMAIVQGGLSNVTLPSSLNVGIGGGYTGGGDAFNWNGRISQTRIYTRELTTAEVQQNYNATKGRYGF